MEAEFRYFCNLMIDVINNRDWDFQKPEARVFKAKHISSDFQAKIDSNPYSMDLQGQTEMWRELVKEYPDAYFVLDGVDCIVHKNDRTADVLMRATMFRGDVRLITACLTQWKFTKGNWQWYRHSGVRGINCETD